MKQILPKIGDKFKVPELYGNSVVMQRVPWPRTKAGLDMFTNYTTHHRYIAITFIKSKHKSDLSYLWPMHKDNTFKIL